MLLLALGVALLGLLMPTTSFLVPSERAALVLLYDETDGKKWRLNDGWLSPEDPCSWYGVSCHVDESHVKELSLKDNDLDGDFPDSLLDLTLLETLAFSENAIYGEMPALIDELSSLKILELEHTRMEGDISTRLGLLSNLTHLTLWNSKFTGMIPSELGLLSDLQYLDVATNRLEGPIPKELGQLSRLSVLFLEQNFFESSIPTELFSLLELTLLHLYDNKLQGTIPRIELPKLQFLSLSINKLEGTLPVFVTPLLTSFDASDNKLEGELPPSLFSSQLTELILSENSFSGSIPTVIANSTLLTLNLHSNEFEGWIPSELAQNRYLITVDLSENNFEGSLPSGLGNLFLLDKLDVSENSLTGLFPESIFYLESLESLDISYNYFSGTIPTNFSDSIEEFSLTRNLFVGGLSELVCDVERFDARLNYFSCQDVPECCTYEGTRSCIPCYEVGVVPATPYPPPTPSPTPAPAPSPGTTAELSGLESAEWIQKDLFFLGSQRKIFEFQMSFRDELYMLESVACESEECTESNLTATCDYSSLDSNGCQDFARCSDGPILCSTDKNFTTLEAGETFTMSRQEANTFKQFRYFSNSSCTAVSIRVASLSGDPDIYVDQTTEPSIRVYSKREERSGGDEVVFCPPDSQGNYYIGIYAYRGLAAYEIVVEEVQFYFPANPPPPPRSEREEGEDEVELEDGRIHEQMDLSANSSPDMHWEPDWEDLAEDNNCTIHFEANGDARMELTVSYGDDDDDESSGEDDGGEEEYSSGVRYEGRNWIVLSYCTELQTYNNDENKDASILPSKFSLKVYGSGDATVLVTSKGIIRSKSLTNYPAADLIFQIERRKMTNGLSFDYALDCSDFDNCSDITIWSGVTGNAFYPPHLAADLVSEFLIYDDDLPGQSKKLFTYLNLPTQSPRFYGTDGTVYGSIEEYEDDLEAVAKTLSVTLGRTFVDKDGFLIVTPPFEEITSSPQTVICYPEDFQALAEELTTFLEANFPTDNSGTAEEVGQLIEDLIRIDAQRYNTTWSACERQMYEFFDMGDYNWTRGLTYEQICLLTEDEAACEEEGCGDEIEGLFETLLVEQLRDEVVDESCLDPECATLFLNDFGEDQNFLRGRLCSTEGTLGTSSIDIDSLWYRNCKKDVLGFDKRGKECFSDSDCYIPPNCTNGVCTTLGRVCDDDADCVYDSECNFFSNLCTTDPETTQNMFLKCYVDNMPLAQQQALAQKIGKSVDPTSREFFNSVKELFATQDCIGTKGTGLNTSLPFREHYDLNVLTSSFTDLYGCRCSEQAGEVTSCLDSLCLAPDSCEFLVYQSLDNLLSAEEQTSKAIGCTVFSGEDSGNPSNCLIELACNWLAESSYTYSNVSASNVCENPTSWLGGPPRDSTHFCAICLGNTLPCVEIYGVETESECDDIHVCLTPSGGYILKTSAWEEGECEKVSGECAGFCPTDTDVGDDDDDGFETDFPYDDDDVDCISRVNGAWAVCFYDVLVTQMECIAFGGSFAEVEEEGDDDDVLGECLFPHLTIQKECEDVGLTYFSCDRLTNEDCANYEETMPTKNNYLNCFLSRYNRCPEEQCKSPFGICSDASLVNLETPAPLAPSASCVIPFAQGEESEFCPDESFVTQLGCVYQDYPYYNETVCESVGGKMVSASGTKEECLAQGAGCESGQTSKTGLYTDLEPAECESCGGTFLNYFIWRDAEWVVGKSKKPNWIQRESVQINTLGDTIDYIAMAEAVAEPALDDFFVSMESEGLCTSSIRVINAINVIACGCNGFVYSGSFSDPTGRTEIVFTDTNSMEVSSDIPTDYDDVCEAVTNETLPIKKNVCPETSQSLVSTSTFLSFTDAFEDGVYVCLVVTAEYLGADDYTEPISNPISVSFLRSQTLESVYAVVRNDEDVVVGQLIGDGVQVNVTSDIKGWEEFLPLTLDLLCFAVREDITILSDYNTYDVGLLNPDTGIISPIKAVQGDSRILALTDFLCFDGVLVAENNSFFPIAVEKDWEDARVLTTAERAIVFTTAALYTIGLLILIFFFTGVPLHSISGPMKTNYIIGAQCFILYIFRAVYFYLLGTYVVPGDSEDVTDYILIEIPTFLYLGMFILIVLSFLFVYLRGYRDIMLSDRVFWGCFLASQIFIWLSFIAVVVALATLDEGGEETRSCSGRLTDETVSEKDDARVIRIAYKSAIVFISLIVVILMTVLTLTIQQKGTVFLQVLFASFGLLINSIAFIVYYALDDPSTYFAIVLWVTELVPTLVMCLIVSPRRYFDNEKKSRQRDKSSSKSPESSQFSRR